MQRNLVLVAMIGAILSGGTCVFGQDQHWDRPPVAAGKTGLVFRDLPGFKFKRAELKHVDGETLYWVQFDSPKSSGVSVGMSDCGTGRVPDGPKSEEIKKRSTTEALKFLGLRPIDQGVVRIGGVRGLEFRRVTHVDQRGGMTWDAYLVGYAGQLFKFAAVYPTGLEAAGDRECRRFIAEFIKPVLAVRSGALPPPLAPDDRNGDAPQ